MILQCAVANYTAQWQAYEQKLAAAVTKSLNGFIPVSVSMNNKRVSGIVKAHEVH